MYKAALYLKQLVFTLTEISCLFVRILLCTRSTMATTTVTKSIAPVIPPAIATVLSSELPWPPVMTCKHHSYT